LQEDIEDKSDVLEILESRPSRSRAILVGVGLGDEVADGLGEIDGAAALVGTPLFHTNLEPFLIHV
jgi:hypothetical protein